MTGEASDQEILDMSTVVNERRRRFLTASTTVVGTTGLAVTAWPFIASWRPSARARAAGAPVVVDVSKLGLEQQITIEWRGKPVWILRRTPGMLEQLSRLSTQLRDPDSRVATQQPVYAQHVRFSVRG